MDSCAIHMRPMMSNDDRRSSQALPPELEAVALIDAETCAAAGSMSLSWWYREVQAGNAPQPAVRAFRCTRWRLADVREFWRQYSERGDAGVAAAAMQAQSKKAAARSRDLRSIGKTAGALV